MPKYLLALVCLIALGGCTTANTVYLYDGAGSETAKYFNDIPVWKDATSAQSSVRGADIRNWAAVKCQYDRARGAERKRTVGNAVEVRVHGGCTGFVNSAYVHAEK